MEEEKLNQPEKAVEPSGGGGGGGGGGWGGWGVCLSECSCFFLFCLLKAVEVAKSAAKGISELQTVPESESVEEEGSSEKVSGEVKTEEDERDRMRKSALDRLEKASDDTLLGQGLKVLDNSMESLASGAWNVLGNAWKGAQPWCKEHSAVNIADSIGDLPANASSLAPIIEVFGKTFTAKGFLWNKETMELLISETGLDTEKDPRETDQLVDEQFEEVTFDRCFYIYGGPEYLEELEALSNHYALLFNRKKAKLLSEQKSLYDSKLKQIQQTFRLDTEIEESVDAEKGKKIENTENGNSNEMKDLRDSSVSRAAEVAAGMQLKIDVYQVYCYPWGLATNEIIQKTADRLETIHSEGVHRLSELCCFAVSQLLTLGKSVISNGNNSPDKEQEDAVNIDWPEDSVLKAKIIRSRAQSMTGDVEAVSKSFITGISDIIEACLAATKGAAADASDAADEPAAVQEKAQAVSELLRAGQSSALDKIQDALQYLAYVVLSTSMPAA
ncbi:unnamed protein product [Spirodela intermedia]|uniref:DUF7798 domain-containing protein n=1 Tax=Spirodela intermedia TaxID=51605 RepID=A0A7I8IJT7_SPIIN|nr:unnamed protein product [Spirodela intermedia]CAA6657764.1 unnamed protein product [Spirodela intermedia]